MINLDDYTLDELQEYLDSGFEPIEEAYCESICCRCPDHDSKQWDNLRQDIEVEVAYRKMGGLL